MADRLTLVHSKLEEFAAWAVAQGFKREPAKPHAREILRLRLDNEPPLIFYQRNNCNYVTVPSGGQRTVTGYALVTRWLRSQSTPAVAATAPLKGPGDLSQPKADGRPASESSSDVGF